MIIFIEILISILLGVFINYILTSELIVMFFGGSPSVYGFVVYFALILQILFIFVTIHFLRTNKINKVTYFSILCAYLALLFLLLFGRPVMEQNINLNILNIFNFEQNNLLQNILNLAFFIPFGFFLYDVIAHKVKIKQILIISFCLIFTFEILQFISLRGIFDIVDIFLNMIGVLLGVIIATKKSIYYSEINKD